MLKLIDKLPNTFIMLGCVAFSIHKLCLSNKGLLISTVRFIKKEFKELNNKIDKNTEEIQNIKNDIIKIKTVDERQDQMIFNQFEKQK